MAMRSFPVGPPTQVLDEFVPVTDKKIPYKGLIKATVRPPKGLRLPLLPYRVEEALTFPVCGECARNSSQSDCSHTEAEREITGTWVSAELQVCA